MPFWVVDASSLGLQTVERGGVTFLRLVFPDARAGAGVEHGAVCALLLWVADEHTSGQGLEHCELSAGHISVFGCPLGSKCSFSTDCREE